MLVPQVLLFLFVSVASSSEPPLAHTPLGAIRGYVKTTHDGTKYSSFEGIPFAKPPIGSRRFQDPEPIEPWHGTWDASHLTTCPQLMFATNETAGQEDCLYLNIYVPREIINPDGRLDVVVLIHGGAFMYGSGHYLTPPDNFIERTTILVSFNYRLGVFGFLSTEDEVLPGNMGLKDQVMALRWVKNNIASFGGNPDSVTLTGLSAGAASVHLHYFSPMSRGLFHRGVSHSGTATNFWVLQNDPLGKANRLGRALGCPLTSTKETVNCLREKHVGQILEKSKIFFEYKFCPLAPFAPVVEKFGQNRFLPESPFVLLEKGEVLDVPWIASNTAHEGLFQKNFLVPDLGYLESNWDYLAPILFEYKYSMPESYSSISEKIKKKYFGNQFSFERLVDIFSDRFFTVGTENGVRLHAKSVKSPVYYYLFSYLGDNNDFKMVGHGDESKYFYISFFDPRPLTPNELKMRDILMGLVVSFAKNGKPPIHEVAWSPTKSDELTFLNISGPESGEITLQKTDDITGSRDFWIALEALERGKIGSKKDEL